MCRRMYGDGSQEELGFENKLGRSTEIRVGALAGLIPSAHPSLIV